MKDRLVTKEEVLESIRRALADVENAITFHPPETVALYREVKTVFIDRQYDVQETEWSQAAGLSLGELATVHQYLLASAFMATWFHMREDKTHRDAAAHSACTLVVGLGIQPKDAMQKHVQYEQLWRRAIRGSLHLSARRRGCLSAVLVAFLGVAACVCISAILAGL